jgi:hypothetical protein
MTTMIAAIRYVLLDAGAVVAMEATVVVTGATVVVAIVGGVTLDGSEGVVAFTADEFVVTTVGIANTATDALLDCHVSLFESVAAA